MNERQRQNIDIAKRYVDLYNTDPDRFVRECYHDDFKVVAMGISEITGVDKFIAVEKAVLKAAPKRLMRVDKMHATDEVVVVEAAVVDAGKGADWEIPFCAVLVMRGDKIAIDRTYADYSQWPGLNSAM